ncbi:thiamine biosynthesis lipoprotein [Catenuloplanes niger]|uniref:FAD:protein FMN transferase n=2 Tax=Micromonosporaceae TaxID=28056 RepID=A0AAE3ZJJ3_9ACTN|nr:thiamine biosynthesis lipoprotein [Catenuloplanes niger]
MRHVEMVMGTAVSIELAADRPAPELRALIGDVCGWLHEVDARFSTYKQDSEVSRMRRGELTSTGCHPDLRHVLGACADLWRATDGYFDAYYGGVLDPSGYVKGWAVAEASQRLVDAGCPTHFISAGGDIAARGDRVWRVGVRHPWDETKVAWKLAVRDAAVATSGTYERGGHVINPRTGKPARFLRSVTVTGPDLTLADAYATAALAMDRDGLRYLEKLATDGYESAAVTEDGRAFTTPGLPVAT